MTGQISMGEREEREDSVRKCRGMFPSSRELQKSRRGGAVLSTSRDARLTVWSGSINCIVIQHFVEVCHYQYVIPLPRYHWSLDTGLFSVFYIVVVILESPYTCELKIVTGLPWENFQFIIFAWSFHAPPFLPLASSLCAPVDSYISALVQFRWYLR